MAIALVQQSGSTHSRVGDAGSLVCTAFGSSTTAGNYLVLPICSWNSGTPDVTSITDTFTNSWAEAAADIVQGAAHVSIWWSKLATGGSSHACTINTTAGSYTVCRPLEFSGIAASSAVDLAVTTGADDSSSPFTLTSGAKSQDEELVVVCMGTSAIDSNAQFQDPPTTGYTRTAYEPDGSAYTPQMAAYKFVNAAGTESVSMTFVSSPVRGVMVSFKAAAAAAGVPKTTKLACLGVG